MPEARQFMTLARPKPVKRVKVKSRLRHSLKPIARHSALKRGERPRPMRRGANAEMKREAERLMSQIVLRDGLCVYLYLGVSEAWYCGRPATDCAHVLAKGRHASVRYSPANGLPLCRMHHEEVGSAKLASPSPMRRLYVTLMGVSAWHELLTAVAMRRQPISQILTELRALAKEKGVDI